MIHRGTDIKAALRSRQRGFLLNPYRFGSSPAIPSDVVLYVRGNGADGSTTIIDSSTHARTLTAYGGVEISTDQSLWGGSSVRVTGAAGDRFAAAASSDFDFGSGDMTIAAWVWIDANSPPDSVDGARGAAIGSTWLNGTSLAGLRGWIFAISGNTTDTGTGLQLDSWDPAGTGSATLFRASASIAHSGFHHVQGCVSGGARYLFLDGVLLSGSTITLGGGYAPLNSGGSDINFGSSVQPEYPVPLNGYTEELLVIKGRALNTANFTPPAGPYFP